MLDNIYVLLYKLYIGIHRDAIVWYEFILVFFCVYFQIKNEKKKNYSTDKVIAIFQ